MITQLAHICIHTRDLAESERFYLDALGLQKGFVFEKNGKRFGFYINLGGRTFIEIFTGEPIEIGNIDHLALETTDIDRVISSLRESGFDISDKSLGADHTWQAWTKDPNGVRIEFHQYTDESMQFEGGICKVDW